MFLTGICSLIPALGSCECASAGEDGAAFSSLSLAHPGVAGRSRFVQTTATN